MKTRGNEKDVTYLRVKKETRDLMAEIGKKSETYDELIRRLLREAGYLDEEGNLVRRV